MSFKRMAGWAGVGFVVLNVVAFLLFGTPPGADAPASEIADYVADAGNAYKVGTALTGIATVLFVPFLAGLLVPFFRSDREHSEGFGVVVFAGALLSGTAATLGLSATAALSLRAGAELDAATTRALWDLSYVAYGSAILAVPILAGGAAMAIQKRGVMPDWFGNLSWLVALLGFTGIFGLVSTSGLAYLLLAGYLGLLVWVLVAGIVLVREQPA